MQCVTVCVSVLECKVFVTVYTVSLSVCILVLQCVTLQCVVLGFRACIVVYSVC